ncbi:unnamed protein product [Orchesella dallaii]|uniref:Uncharacterized protein n=1 Tax=Orchesella dallaii TaxID=48710 RepID=A0ABP1S8A4_9HEXA
MFLAKQKDITVEDEEMENLRITVNNDEGTIDESAEESQDESLGESEVEDENVKQNADETVVNTVDVHDADTIELLASDEELFQSPPSSPQATRTGGDETNTSAQAQSEPIARRLRSPSSRRKPARFEANFLTKEEIPEPSTLEKICPIPDRKNAGLSKSRQKRFVLEAALILIIVAIAVPGIVMGGYAIYRAEALSYEVDNLNSKLDELEKEVFKAHNRTELLHKEVKELARAMDTLQKDLDNFKRKSVQLSYLISSITGKLIEEKLDMDWDENEEKIKKSNLNDLYEGDKNFWFFVATCILLCIVIVAAAVVCFKKRKMKKEQGTAMAEQAAETRQHNIIIDDA